jgi:hypothetical protein
MFRRLLFAAVAAGLLAPACSSRDHCPDRDDPKVHYVDEDPAVCERTRFLCAPGSTAFHNDCGCGCIEG